MYTFFKGIFFQNVAMDTENPVLTAPTKRFLQKAKTFLLIFRKRYNVFEVFLRKVFFFKTFWWKHKKQFWQPCRIGLGTNWNFFARCTNMFRLVYIFQSEMFFFKILLWDPRTQFWRTYRICSGRRPIPFQSISENINETSIFFQKSVSPRNVLTVTYYAIWKTPQEISRQKAEKF